jgi:glutamine synthetase
VITLAHPPDHSVRRHGDIMLDKTGGPSKAAIGVATPLTTPFLPRAEAEAFLAAHPAITQIQALLVDIHGKARGKIIKREALPGYAEKGVTIPNAPFSCDIWGKEIWQTGLVYETGDKDNHCFPIAGTLHVQPWGDGATAQVLVRPMLREGPPNPVCPRTLLDQAIAALGAHGLSPTVAFELEFYLFKPFPAGAPRPIDLEDGRIGPKSAGIYGIDELDGVAPFLADVQAFSQALGVPADTALSEGGHGQFEVNLLHRAGEPMRAADDAFVLRRIVSAAAIRHGFHASFMPKPAMDRPGSGMHVHVSLQDREGANAFSKAGGETVMHHVLGGMLATLRETQILFSPGFNGYRRTRWLMSPPHTVTWAHDNRIAALRIPNSPPQARRFEHRTAGSDANPYLTLAAILFGCAEGLDRQLDPGKEASGTTQKAGVKRLHREMFDAWMDFSGSDFVARRFGKLFRKVYSVLKEQELTAFESHVGRLEHEAYL